MPEQAVADKPAGGLDRTPVPYASPGYTVKFTFHRATDLPMSDLRSLASDPFILAQINTALPSRHKEDPVLRLRTPTAYRSLNPVWNCEWIVANIPASGFRLKARIYDEDAADHDDRLGNVHVTADGIDESWAGIREKPYKIKKRMGSKRAYAIRAVAVCLSDAKHMSGHLYVSAEVLGRTKGDNGGRVYTVGPLWWTRHHSPLLGRLVGRKEPKEEQQEKSETTKKENEKAAGKKMERYSFQATQFQLEGPVPSELYHRYVEFRPFVKRLFTSSGIRGYFLSKALHHQHSNIYNFDRSTMYGKFDSPSRAVTLQFLDLVHYDMGGRIFTYVLTLDSLFRFTETGKEFGIDLLSKHTMHSDVSVYIAFSGEFFVRRMKHAHRHSSEADRDNPTHPPDDIGKGPPRHEPPKDPAYYELIIDNDSGTYRPNGELLPLLKQFLQHNLPGLKIVTLDCMADGKRLEQLKQEQRERKKAEGDMLVYRQLSRTSSISSSDEEALEALADGEEQSSAGEEGLFQYVRDEIVSSSNRRTERLKDYKPGHRDKNKGFGIGEEKGSASWKGSQADM